MPAPLLLDLSHTSHTRARTGVQRVTRGVRHVLGAEAVAITHDPHAGTWRPLAAWEEANLTTPAPAGGRGAHWPLLVRWRGHTQRIFGSPPAVAPALTQLAASALLVPEIFSATTARALPALFAATAGPRVAVFHDAIALKYPELTPTKTVARFPSYLRELLAFDGIAAVSDDSRAALVDYWRWLGIGAMPPVVTIPLGLETPAASTSPASLAPDRDPVVLAVGSVEGRKNHVALFAACEELWRRGVRFELHVIGLAHPQTGATAVARMRELQAQGRPLRYAGPVDDPALEAAYAACTFTVYPSLMEGFGLPVLESLARGKPCICSAHGALGEAARSGGCLALASVDSPRLAAAMERLLVNAGERAALVAAARARNFRTWNDYARDLRVWLNDVRRR